MSLLRRHRTLRDVPEGDVITKTEPEIDAEGDTRSAKGKTDQPTGENPKPARESATKPKQAPKDDA